ncbi:serine O-acetyltransferase [Mucilaginibacter flavus]|uniref:serine O-acetyltransferase n=1 Tax=Mucilaginibacter flavus TaxID=931504 RepID=UPI0025B303B3|nr:DapH/DapD/GlmU-related protein [Mucilaginibacter flavus]MDN3583742.1 DapH/DapD/GlmU-related protein [Mucilaginibacter flavus]
MMFNSLRLDIHNNKGNFKGLFFILFFRLAQLFLKKGFIVKLIGLPFTIAYKFTFPWILGIDIPLNTEIGTGFMVFHGQGLIVHGDCKIGSNVLIRHNTTLGQKSRNGGVPIIGNNVDIGAHSIIIGSVKIGDNCIIGAGTFINVDIPENSIVYGRPLVIKSI